MAKKPSASTHTAKSAQKKAVAHRRRAAPARKTAPAPEPSAPGTKLEQVVGALRRSKGVTIPDLMQLTGWQSHSVRGVISGALKKQRGLKVVSEKVDGERRYRIAA